MNIETANRLVKLRKEHGFSQETLAEKIGVSRQAVSKWERSEASPDTDNLILLAQLYNVSLDELLLGKEAEETHEEPAASEPEASEPETSETETSETETTAEDAKDQVSFKGGIHVRDKHGAKVDIGFDGIHVEDAGDGSKVHIDRHGVFVSENGEEYPHHTFKDIEPKKKNKCRLFPFPILVAIAYLLLGAFCNLWWIAWILFLTIPLYYTLIDAVEKRNPDHFAYPILVTAIYLFIGMAYGLWHPWWWLFLTIPAYYGITAIFKGKT